MAAAPFVLVAFLTFVHEKAERAEAAGAVAAVSVWDNRTCALTNAGGVKCWGRNEYGELGNGTTWSFSTPTDVFGLTAGVVSVSTGEYHTCALTTAGGVKCWGNNAYGQLGIGTSVGPQTCLYVFACSTTPVDVPGLTSGVIAVDAGGWHTCALTSSGGVKCWGDNTLGGLGNVFACYQICTTPVDVSGLTGGVAEISAGGLHTCARMIAGGTKCWGYNAYGQLGDGTTSDHSTPVDVSGLSPGTIADISAGGLHTCALSTAGGVKCWGFNESGRLGIGASTGPETCVVQSDAYACSTTPLNVSGLTNPVSVSAGHSVTCAVTSVGGVKCWGNDGDGQLGDGTSCGPSPCGSSVPADVTGLASGIAAVSAGTAHVCAVETADTLKCWGSNFYGQLGIGTNAGPEVCGISLTACSTVPLEVTSLPAKPTPTAMPTPPPVGGVSRDAEQGASGIESEERGGAGAAWLAVLIAGATVALGGAAWVALRRVAGGR